jgi:ketosteroid isomerase-like protein
MASTRMRFPRVLPLLATTLAILCGATTLPAQSSAARAHGPGSASAAPEARADSAAVLRVIESFHSALVAGDAATALGLLTDDAMIIENGRAETRERYSTLHLSRRIDFAQAVQTERRVVRTQVHGDVAWVSSTGTARDTYQGRLVTATGTELMILTRTPEGWRISEIHWSAHIPRAP